MAITHVGSAPYTVASGSGSEIKTLPGPPQAGDVVAVLMGCDDRLDLANILTPDYQSIRVTTSNTPGRLWARKTMGAIPDTTIEFARDTAFTAVALQIWRGVDVVTVIDNGPSAGATTGSTGNPDPPAYTTLTNGALLLTAAAWDDDDGAASVIAPSGYSNLIAADTGQGLTNDLGATVAMASKIVAVAGTEDPGPFGGTVDDQNWADTTALRPAPAVAASPRRSSMSLGLGMTL